MIKPVEWEIGVHRDRILGYVNDDRWDQFLKDGEYLPSGVFSACHPQTPNSSVLVAFPLRQEELVRKIVYDIENPHDAKVVSVEEF